MIAITNVQLYDFHTYIPNGYVVFEQVILSIGHMDDFSGEYDQVIDGKHKLLMPGLINGHNHIYSTFSRGLQVDFHPNTFQELLEQLWWKLDRNLNNNMNYLSALISGIENVKHGVTTIIDHHASGEIRDSLSAIKKGLTEVGTRSVLCFETSDRFDIKACIKENKTVTNPSSAMSSGLVGLHASFTLKDETLQQIANAFPETPIHIHVAESMEDQEHAIKTYQKRVIERLDSFGLIRKDSILVHGIYLDDHELEIIKQAGAVIAINITSNMNNGVGIPNVKAFQEKGIPVIIGNDGMSQQIANEYQALYLAMHSNYQSPTAFTFKDVMQIIEDTYQYVSKQLQCKLGRIQPGYEADLVLLDYIPPTPINNENIFGHLLFGAFHDFQPSDVFIGGTQVLNNYKTYLDEQQIYQQARTASNELWTLIQKEGMSK